MFTAALGELAAIGLTAGLLGAAVALPLTAALGLHASPGRAALAVPVAVGVAVVAGTVPAWLAASADPVTSVRPPCEVAISGGKGDLQPDGSMPKSYPLRFCAPGHRFSVSITVTS